MSFKGNRPVAPVRSPKAEPGFILLLWLQHMEAETEGRRESSIDELVSLLAQQGLHHYFCSGLGSGGFLSRHDPLFLKLGWNHKLDTTSWDSYL